MIEIERYTCFIASNSAVFSYSGQYYAQTQAHSRKNLFASNKQHAALEKSRVQIPIVLGGEQEKFAKSAVFSASSANTFLAGQSLIINDGLLKSLK